MEFKGLKINLFGVAACVSALTTLLLALKQRKHNHKRKGRPDAEADE